MTLHNVERVRVHLIERLANDTSLAFERPAAQKGLDVISVLEKIEGLDRWIEYAGHLTLILYHASPFAIERQRAIRQVLIDPRDPCGIGIQFLLPKEKRPWEYCSGFAKDVPEAVELILDALRRCENRDEYLYETIP